jgi:hypothetical protein
MTIQKLWCSFCKTERENWLEKTSSIMCPDCEKKCQACGGTGKNWIHPRLGLWTPCACSFGQALFKEPHKSDIKGEAGC